MQVWEADDGIYKLVSCPTGYSKIRDDNDWENQMCDPCPKGYECTLTICEECTECASGHYKAVIGYVRLEALPSAPRSSFIAF